MSGAGTQRLADRLFVAVWPPPGVVDALAPLVRPDEPGVRWVPPGNWHVTLRFLGEADAGEVERRLSAATLPAATAVLGPAVGRLGRDAVVVPVAGLDPLAAAVRAATAGVGRPGDPRPFHGHLTIARLRGRAAGGVAGDRVAARFEVTHVCLVRSTTAPTGAVYETLTRFALGDS